MRLQLVAGLEEIWKPERYERHLPEDRSHYAVEFERALAESVISNGRVVKLRIQGAKSFEVEGGKLFSVHPDLGLLELEFRQYHAVG